MANGINIQGPQPIVIEDPGKNLLQGVGSTVLRGVISDIFSDVRAERTKQITTLWEGIQLNTKAALSLSDPNEVQEAMTELQLEYDNPRTPSGVKPGLEQLMVRLENHYDKVLKDQPAIEAISQSESYDSIMAEIKQEGSNLNKDIPFLEKTSESLQSDIDYLISQAIPTADRKKRIASINAVKSSYDTLNEEIYPEFAKKYMTTSGVPRDDLTEDQLIDMQADKAYINAYMAEADRILQEDALMVEEFNAPDYLRRVKKEYALAGALDDMIQNKSMVDNTINVSKAQKDFQISINEFERKMEDSKSELTTEEFARQFSGSSDLLKDLNKKLADNVLFFDGTHKKMLREQEINAKTILGSLSVLDAVERISKQGPLDSPKAQIELDNALQFASDAVISKNTRTASMAFTSLNKALTSERVADAVAIKKMTTEKSALEETARGRITPVVKSISQKLATAEKRGKNLDSSYSPGGSYELSRKPDQFFQNFTLERDVNVKGYKSEVGKEIATLVKSSNLDGMDKKQKLIVNDLANKARKGDFEAADELYSILQSESKNLDFEGTRSKDSNAQEIYEQYLKLYGILFETDIEASSKFGTDYGYGQLKQAGNLQSATNEPLDWF
jgi:hypothetical protein